MPLWFDQHLKGGPALPQTPLSELVLQTTDHIPQLRIVPDAKTLTVARCEIYYSVDPDPRARFWRSAEMVRDGEAFVATLPLHTLELPLFAFANVYHTLSQPVSLAAIPGNSKPITEICLSSQLHSREAAALRDAGVVATLKSNTLIDDFAKGLRDWYQLNAGNLTHQQTWTRKVTDPLYRGPDNAKLKFTVKMPRTNTLSFVVQQNEWRDYRGPRKTFVCRREIHGSDEAQSVTLAAADFTSGDGPLASWKEADQFGICAHFGNRGNPAEEPLLWQGPPPEFLKLEWT
jgi:hypothetical protein